MAEFRKGIEKVQASAERSGSFVAGGRRYFKWDPDETKVIRFLTEGDGIVLTNVHEFVVCDDNKKRSFVCRKELGEECELCGRSDVKRREVAYAVALWREEYKKDGKTLYRTKTEKVEVEENGKTVTKTVPWVGILQQAPRNFWSWFWSAYDKSGTLQDRDYSVTRRGKEKETTYQPYPEDKQELDLSKFEEYKPDIEEMLTFLGSKEYYDSKLHGIEPTKAEATPKDDSDLTDDDLAAIRAANEKVTADVGGGEFD